MFSASPLLGLVAVIALLSATYSGFVMINYYLGLWSENMQNLGGVFRFIGGILKGIQCLFWCGYILLIVIAAGAILCSLFSAILERM